MPSDCMRVCFLYVCVCEERERKKERWMAWSINRKKSFDMFPRLEECEGLDDDEVGVDDDDDDVDVDDDV